MFLYAILSLLLGAGLLVTAALLARGLHRRYGLPYALLTVGVLTGISALLVQAILLQVVDRALLGILPLQALALGLLAGFVEECARLLGYQYLAQSADSKPQALMIGLGHGLTETIYAGILAAGLGISLLGHGGDPPDDTLAEASGALAEAINSLLPVVMHMALSWIVLQVFLRGELSWLFVAVFLHASTEMMAVLLGPGDDWRVVAWRGVVALIGAAIITRLHAPPLEESAAQSHTSP